MVDRMDEYSGVILGRFKPEFQAGELPQFRPFVDQNGCLRQVDACPDLLVMGTENDIDRETECAVSPENEFEKGHSMETQEGLRVSHAGGASGGQDNARDHGVNARQAETVVQASRLRPKKGIAFMSIQVTEKAANKIRESLEKQGLEAGGLRLGVRGGGCSGLSYVMRFEAEKKPGDKVFETNGARIFVDMKSYLYLKGMTLDWRGTLMQQAFMFINPNAKRSCGCGQSFTV